MTNYEWLVKNDAELVRSILTRHLSNVKGRPSSCSRTHCSDCDFDFGNGSGNCRSSCITNAKKWLEQEHEPLYKKGDIVVDSCNQMVLVGEDDCGGDHILISRYIDAPGCLQSIPITDIKRKVGRLDESDFETDFDTDWWNAPYRKE